MTVRIAARVAALVATLTWAAAAQAVPVSYAVSGSFDYDGSVSPVTSTSGLVVFSGTFVLDVDTVGGTGSLVSANLDFGSFSVTNSFAFWSWTLDASNVQHSLSAGAAGTLDTVSRTLSFSGASQISGAAPSGSEVCNGSNFQCNNFTPSVLVALQPFDADFVFDATYSTFSVSLNMTDADGNTYTVASATGVPEPASHMLMALGLVGLALYGRRRDAEGSRG